MKKKEKNKKKLNEVDKKRHQKDLRLQRTYGITLREWEDLSKNGCWICGRKDGRLNVDHRHVVGYKKLNALEKRKEVRGSLCFLCNTMLGKLERRKNARWLLERTVEYFKVFRIKGDE